jgi:CDP-6-deoxy-D-xylo-4-hexulose-3-dehydrase
MWKLMENIIEVEDKSNLISFLESSDRFTNGPKVQEFENVWSNWLGTSNSVMVNSGASANYLSIALVKELFGKGEVIVPSLGWSSDVSSIIQLGLTPVFVDINKKTLGINFDSLKQAVNENTKAIVVVHALGFNALTDEIMQFLKARGIFVIEDCCEAHGAVISAKALACNSPSLSLAYCLAAWLRRAFTDCPGRAIMAIG